MLLDNRCQAGIRRGPSGLGQIGDNIDLFAFEVASQHEVNGSAKRAAQVDVQSLRLQDVDLPFGRGGYQATARLSAHGSTHPRDYQGLFPQDPSGHLLAKLRNAFHS